VLAYGVCAMAGALALLGQISTCGVIAARRGAAHHEQQSFAEVKTMEIDPAEVTERLKGTLSDLLGMRVVEATPDRVVAELLIRDEIRTVGGSLHGGTLMALADTIGATATVLNLPPGAGTTTLESKTNFFAAGREGVVRAESTPLHRGKRTQVWQTRITDASGRLLSLTIQTQMVLM
jgi:uncharacterized protein (TIGR00369 family)